MSVYFGDPEQDRKIMKRGDYLDLPCTVEEFKNLFWSPSRDVPTSVNANGDVTDNGGISDLLVTSRDVFVSRGIAPKVDAEEVARRISEALQPLVEKMRELSTSMSKIGEILKEIGEHIKDNEEVDCPECDGKGHWVGLTQKHDCEKCESTGKIARKELNLAE